MTEQFWANLIS